MWTQRAVRRPERNRWPRGTQPSVCGNWSDWPPFDQAGRWSVTLAARSEARGADHEAHLSAESTSAREESWVPGSDADSRRPVDPGRTAEQGSHPTLCLTMLPAHHRLRASGDFVVVLRSGRRGASASVVIHALTRPDSQSAPRIGFAVSRAVGNSVVRHRVARRLRALIGVRLERLAPGTLVVVRALPKAATASHQQLGADLDAALVSAGL